MRTLPCLHSACLECLESLVAQKGGGNPFFFKFSFPILICIYSFLNSCHPRRESEEERKAASKKKKESPAVDVGKATCPVVQCPACQSPFDLPVADLPTNPLVLTALSSLAAAVLSSSSSSSSSTSRRNGSASVNPNEIKCEICEPGSEEDAVSFCQDCVQYFCAGCQRAHKRVKSAASHEFVSIEAALKGKLKEKLAHCVKHPVFLMNSYCGKVQ